MATTIEVVDTVQSCRAAVASLEREPVVAVDSEGVHLSRTGPMTLLQIANDKGYVYLFDVGKQPRLFKDGGLKGFLENGSVTKVMHSARNDSESLFYQHGVELRSVHDTQVACMEMDRAEGRLFPKRQKLQEICHTYCPAKEHLLAEGKGAVQTKCNKTEGAYWATRPLKEEMKQYAANDVITLIPEIYQEQKRLLEQKGLMRKFNARVELELRRSREQKVEDDINKEDKKIALGVLQTFAASPGASDKTLTQVDDNVLDALERIPISDLPKSKLPPFIKQLQLQQIKDKLDEIQKELDEQGDNYEVSGTTCRRLHGFATYVADVAIKQRAKQLEERINKVINDDIIRKYTADTPASYLDSHEKLILSRMRTKGENDPSINPVLLKLHWKVRLEDLEDNIAKFQKDRNGYKATEGYAKLLRFYYSGPVPATIKTKASAFLKELQAAGKVSRPTPRLGTNRGFDFAAALGLSDAFDYSDEFDYADGFDYSDAFDYADAFDYSDAFDLGDSYDFFYSDDLADDFGAHDFF